MTPLALTALIFGLMLLLMALRTPIAIAMFAAGSMIMGVPEWIVYVGMVPPLVLTAVIALVQAARGFPTHGEQVVEGRA